MLGSIKLEEFKGLTSMPQKAASAWDAVMNGLVGVSYKPLLYCGSQVVKGTNYYFIAESTTVTAKPQRRIVKVIINEFSKEYTIANGCFEIILG